MPLLQSGSIHMQSSSIYIYAYLCVRVILCNFFSIRSPGSALFQTPISISLVWAHMVFCFGAGRRVAVVDRVLSHLNALNTLCKAPLSLTHTCPPPPLPPSITSAEAYHVMQPCTTCPMPGPPLQDVNLVLGPWRSRSTCQYVSASCERHAAAHSLGSLVTTCYEAQLQPL